MALNGLSGGNPQLWPGYCLHSGGSIDGSGHQRSPSGRHLLSLILTCSLLLCSPGLPLAWLWWWAGGHGCLVIALGGLGGLRSLLQHAGDSRWHSSLQPRIPFPPSPSLTFSGINTQQRTMTSASLSCPWPHSMCHSVHSVFSMKSGSALFSPPPGLTMFHGGRSSSVCMFLSMVVARAPCTFPQFSFPPCLPPSLRCLQNRVSFLPLP